MPLVPVPEYLLCVATTDPDREVVCYLHDAGEQVLATSITWRQFLADVWSRVDYFLEVAVLESRAVGEECVVVGLLAESNYNFLLDLVAMFLLRWQVRSSRAPFLFIFPDVLLVCTCRFFSFQSATLATRFSTSCKLPTAARSS